MGMIVQCLSYGGYQAVHIPEKVLQNDKTGQEKERSGNRRCKRTCLLYMGYDNRQYQHSVISDCHPPIKGK